MENEPKSLPALEQETGINHSPHVVLLGAGASKACCLNGDANGKPLPVMNELTNVLGLESALREAGFNPAENFEQVYSSVHAAGDRDLIDRIDSEVRQYFGDLKLPEEVTLYDRLILGLRDKDLIVTFNWDPLLPQAFRRWRHLGVKLPKLAFLHGNTDVVVDLTHKRSRFASDVPDTDVEFEPSRLLYPVTEKDYNSDPFIKNEWETAQRHFQYAYYVTVYGYSAPKTDVEAREMLLNAWTRNKTMTLAEFDVIDIAPKDQVEASWSDFILETHGSCSDDFSHNILMRHPRRTCEAFAGATLMCEPWHEDPFPETKALDELEEWLKPLIEEEQEGKLHGKPHH